MLRHALIALAVAPLLSGCLAVAAAGVVGVGVVQYHRNSAHADFPNELDEAWKASMEAMKQLGFEPEQPSELGATEGRLLHDDLVVFVERHAEGFTRIRVRVGTFHSADHERRARLVLQEIGTALERQDDLRAWGEKVQGTPAESPAPEK